MNTRVCFLLIAVLLLAGCDRIEFQVLKWYMALTDGLSTEEGVQQVESQQQSFQIQALSNEFEFPWGMEFLPNGRLLITEKPGRLREFNFSTGDIASISGVPEVYFFSQGGLFDVVLHPQFEADHWVYLSYAAQLANGLRTTRVQRFELVDQQLLNAKTIFEAKPAWDTTIHFGGALMFGNDGYLYITMGDRKQRDLAQDLSTHMGKILRYRADGGIPDDNPFVNTAGALPEIFSYGHRNPQGLTIDRNNDEMWAVEHGPQGGDEINTLIAGANYGWPVISHGEEYGGGKIGEGTHKVGMEQAIHYYIPSIATGGVSYYGGSALPGWKNSLFVAGLRSFSVSRIALSNIGQPGESRTAIEEERLLEDMTFRVRALSSGPNELLYMLTENGGLIQISPAASGELKPKAINSP